MKGLYLTEEGKKVIEDKIVELEEPLNKQPANIDTIHYKLIDAYKEILSSATILPVEESWDGVFDKTFSQAYIEKDYPDGVIIIKSKQ
jgi:hypothetical protein